MIRVWQYWVFRPKGFLAVTQFAILGIFVVLFALKVEASAQPVSLPALLGLLLVLLAVQAGCYLNRVDEAILQVNIRKFLAATAKSAAAGLVLVAAVFALFPNLSPGYTQAFTTAGFPVLALIAARPVMLHLARRRKMTERVLILGAGELAHNFYRELAVGNGSPEGVYTEKSFAPSTDGGVSIHYNELHDLIQRHGITRIIVADSDPSARQGLAGALLDCKMRGLQIEHAADSFEKLSGKIWLQGVRPEWLIYSDGFRPSRYYLPLKNAIDLAGALLLLLVSAPLLLAVALAIKLSSHGPVFFRQTRVGQYGREFNVFKFRSMRQDAEAVTGPTWASDEDPRITPVGRILRKFRLDELPQVFNVLRGEMSLVGPRPERRYFVQKLREQIPYYDLRHYVRPGITGWAQVLYPYGASVEDAYEKLQYDLYYAKRVSLLLDARILLKTVKVVLFGRGR